jgi:hypothetical protein
MEMLVTLILVSFTTMLMFQMLGTYRIAQQRVQSQSGQIDRRALFQSWFRDSINGLFAAKDLVFVGTSGAFRVTTLNPLYAPAGAPTVIEWRLKHAEGKIEIAYFEDGLQRWRQPLEGSDDAHFAYVDAGDRLRDSWPPKLGTFKEGELPAVVMLVRDGESQAQPLAAAVLGPLVPPQRIYGYEQLQ